jgi:tetratricopeptide (TPR) repeat protein
VAAGLLAACSTPPVRSTAQIRTQGFNTQGMDRYKAGDLPHALSYFEQALQTAQSVEDDDAIAVARLNLSMVYLGMGRQDEALKQLDGVLDDPRLAFSNDRRAEAALRRAMAVQAGDRAAAGSGCGVRGKILNLKAYQALQAGRAEEGLRFAQQAQGALAKDDALERANALRLQGSACIALGTPAAAAAPLAEALKLDKAAGASEKIYQDLLLLGQASADRPEVARDYWTRAREVALAANNKAGAERTARLLGASAP